MPVGSPQSGLSPGWKYCVSRHDKAKHFLEENDGAGNTFNATATPVLIGTAVVKLIAGGAVTYWFTGAST